jgi:hypothetical protein
MNMRNLLIAATLALASGSAFAGKAPVILGGFQTSGIVNTPRILVDAVNDKEEKREDKK